MATRRRILLSGGALTLAATTGVLTALPAGAAGFVPAKPAPTAPAPAASAKCSTDIVGRGVGDNVGRKLTFSYTLAGGSCKNALYTLIVRNSYDPRQIAVLAQLGDGRSREITFSQTLPWTPTPSPVAGPGGPDGTGLCVIGVTLKGFHIEDVAPDPSEAPCEPLRGGGARAFH